MLERNAAAWFFYIYFPENRKREFHSEYEKMSHKRVMPETENRFGLFLCFGRNRSAQPVKCCAETGFVSDGGVLLVLFNRAQR